MTAASGPRPVRLLVRDDDLRRTRLTVFLRFFLAVPHFVWLALWGIAAFVVAFVLWLAVLLEGRAPEGLHDFVAGYVRYATHVSAYVFLAADPYPGFRGAPGYPIDVEIDPPERQSRWTGFFRPVLALPALVLVGVLGGGFAPSGPLGGITYGVGVLLAGAGAAVVAAFLTWFATVARGSAPRGLRDLVAYALGYGAQASSYMLLLTPRYPSSDPELADTYSRLPRHPVRIAVRDDLERPRLTVLFRLFLAIPHFVWVTLWAIAALFAVVAAWFSALVTGRVPRPLHRFLAAFVRYSTHVAAFVYLVGRRFPGFTGKPGYGIDVEIDAAEPQRRWTILLRGLLAIPALMLSGALGSVAFALAVLGWWYAVVRRRMPEGLRNLGASCLRYSAQTTAYLMLCTGRYPYAAPVLVDVPPEPVAPVVGDAF